MRMGISLDGEKIDHHEIFPTPSSFDDALFVLDTFLKHHKQGTLAGVSGGVPGPLDSEKNKLVNAPNLPFWIGVHMGDRLKEQFNVPVFLENDTALVGMGEAVEGAGKGKRIVAYLGIGTGVGGVRIVDGEIDRNSLGFEPGHQIIDASSRFPDACGSLGHLEAYVSGSAIVNIYDVSAEQLDNPKVFEDLARLLAVGINNVIVFWSPDVVVLGGSMMKRISIERVKHHLGEICTIFPNLPPLKLATLGDLGGLYGALVYLKQKIETTN